jgi:hypothetical protein
MARPSKFELVLRDELASERQAFFDDLRSRWRACPATAHLHPNYQRACTECIGTNCAVLLAKGLADDLTALTWGTRPACGAKGRSGLPCKNKVVPGKHRCNLHGGLSTGPKTAEGKARIALAQKARWAKLRTAVKVHGGRGK